jgi:hypothetical protein
VKHRLALAVAIAVVFAGAIGFAQQQGRVERSSDSYDGLWVFVSCYDDAGDKLFDIMNKYSVVYTDMTRYDKNGTPIQTIRSMKFPLDMYYNSTDISKFVLGKAETVEVRLTLDAQGNFVTEYASGQYAKVVLPGYGPVFVETGHGKFDWTSGTQTLVSNTGQNQAWDWWYGGIQPDLKPLCDALK